MTDGLHGGSSADTEQPAASDSTDERGMYGQEEIDHAIARLREAWSDERLRELTPLTPYLEEKLASTRREAVRQGYAADGGLDQ